MSSRAPKVRAAPAAPAPAPATAQAPGGPVRRDHPVLSPLRHNGRLYEPGSEPVAMTDAEAEVLIALGVLGEPT